TEAVSSFTVVGDRLVGTTTLDAPRGRVVAAPLDSPGPDRWRTVVPESDDVVEGVAVTAASLLVASSRGALGRLGRLPLAPLPDPGSVVGLAGARDSEAAVVAFTSWARPTGLWRWSPADAGVAPEHGPPLEPWSDLPSPVDPGAYQVGVDRYPSTDGTEVTL